MLDGVDIVLLTYGLLVLTGVDVLTALDEDCEVKELVGVIW